MKQKKSVFICTRALLSTQKVHSGETWLHKQLLGPQWGSIKAKESSSTLLSTDSFYGTKMWLHYSLDEALIFSNQNQDT